MFPWLIVFNLNSPRRHWIIKPSKNRRPIVPDQVTGVVITPSVDGLTYSLQIGPNGESGLSVAALFDRTNFDADHLFGNIRLRRIIGNYGVLWSQEFTDAINERGIRTTGADYYNVTFAVNQDGSYTLGFGSAVGAAPNETITVDPQTLADDTHDLEMVKRNVGAFLRIAGYTDLTTPAVSGVYIGKTAVQAVALWTFRY